MISPCVNMGIRGDFSTLRNARQAAIGFMTHKVRAVSAGVYLDDRTSGSLLDNLPIVQQSARGVGGQNKSTEQGLTP
jgi:hypothetical protein